MLHEHPVKTATFSPDGARVLTRSGPNARVWDAPTGLALSETLRHGSNVNSVSFSPDGQWALTTSGNAAMSWSIHTAPSPVPAWFALFGETIAGRRLNEEQTIEVVGLENLHQLKHELAGSASSDYYTKLGKWFFADRSSRTISPFSNTSLRQPNE